MSQSHYITASEVKKHNTRRSVWLVIRGDVYDVTSFINEHPGGEDPLLDAAGLDATIAFDDVGHSEDAKVMLKKYKIGTLAPGESCCPSAQIMDEIDEKPWRTFDGMPSSHKMSRIRSDYKPPSSPRIERRIQHIVVPRERRGGVCRPEPRPEPAASSGSSRLKWALLALAGAIVIGLAYKKYASG